MILLSEIINKICKKIKNIRLEKKIQNRYLIGLAKKKKKKLHVATLFKGVISLFFFFVSLTCFIFFSKHFPHYENILSQFLIKRY
jgi:hypothetical protein